MLSSSNLLERIPQEKYYMTDINYRELVAFS